MDHNDIALKEPVSFMVRQMVGEEVHQELQRVME